MQGFFLYQAEARERRIRPSIVQTARRVWGVYVLITGALVVYLFVATLFVLPDYPITDAGAHELEDAFTDGVGHAGGAGEQKGHDDCPHGQGLPQVLVSPVVPVYP